MTLVNSHRHFSSFHICCRTKKNKDPKITQLSQKIQKSQVGKKETIISTSRGTNRVVKIHTHINRMNCSHHELHKNKCDVTRISKYANLTTLYGVVLTI